MIKYAALFPGQGSQFSGMGKDIADDPLAKEIFDVASDTIGVDIKKLCSEADAETLKLTANAQPCIYTVSYISYRLFRREFDADPFYAAGHSLGEYTALAAAAVFSFADGLKSVRNRGLFMQEAVPVGIGAMAAVLQADPDDLVRTCNEVSDNDGMVAPANFNCPGQIVISGHKTKVNDVLSRYKGKMLEVSAPFHSALMAPAAEKMTGVLNNVAFNHAAFPIVSNTDNKIRKDKDTFFDALIDQITGSVKWDSGVKKILESGIKHFVEFGPGAVLSGMMKRIDRQAKIIRYFNLSDNEKLRDFLNSDT